MWWIITAAVLRHGVIWFSIGSSGAVRLCRSDGCNSGVMTCVVWLLITVDISDYVLCMPVYVCKGLLVTCGTLAYVYSSSGAGVTVVDCHILCVRYFYTYLVILMLVESRATELSLWRWEPLEEKRLKTVRLKPPLLPLHASIIVVWMSLIERAAGVGGGGMALGPDSE